LDDDIELAEPSFIPLGEEEAAEAVRLLAVLIQAARSKLPEPPRSVPRGSHRSTSS
jgi:hypothetical protein